VRPRRPCGTRRAGAALHARLALLPPGACCAWRAGHTRYTVWARGPFHAGPALRARIASLAPRARRPRSARFALGTRLALRPWRTCGAAFADLALEPWLALLALRPWRTCGTAFADLALEPWLAFLALRAWGTWEAALAGLALDAGLALLAF
jgi:hypothetical protein